MASIISGFEYDIFISYRQKDNKGDHWVTQFVNSLRTELFLIPIISQTYCDTKSFAWQQEFCAFNKLAKEDQFGREIKLGNGNVASRILPIRIHGLDAGDQKTLESEIGSALRAVEFIYKEPGVNRPLSPDDDPSDNLNKTKYRNQVNKVANAIKEIIAGLQNFGNPDFQAAPRESLQVESKPPTGKSIVVLPFEDMSPEKDQAYFCDGLAEELINALTKIKDIHVVARTSAFSFKGKEHDARKIGKKLKVESLLEGSVRKAGNQLRITVQLINVADGFPLWSERYDREVADVFAIQDEIALNVVDKLKISLSGSEKKLIVKRHTENIEAYSLYLKGRHFSWLFTDEGFKKAMHYLNQAIEQDPNYALAYSGLSDLYSIISIYGTVHPKEAQENAKVFADKALGLDETLAEAHLSQALVRMFADWNWNEAGKAFDRALELGPGSSVIYMNYSVYMMVIGNRSETIRAAKKAVELDPLSPTANQHLGFAFWTSGRFDESLAQLRKTLELSPSHAWAQLELGWNYAFKGMYQEAVAECEKAISIYPQFDPWFRTTIACILAMSGRTDDAMTTLRELVDQSQKRYVDPLNFAALHAWLGNREDAIRWLEKAYNEHSGLLSVRPTLLWLKPISSDARFKVILRKMGWEKAESIVSSLSNSGTSPHEKSIVVLPFENMSPDKENEYFSDGLTEEIIANLSRIKSLKVLSRTSSMHYKGAKKPLAQIARELGVEYVLEGSVRKQGKDVRITAQLIEAGQDLHLWTEMYDRRLKDIFAIQSDIALRVAESLRASLTREEEEKIQGAPTESVEAYDYYLLGRYHWFRFTEDGVKKAGEFFGKALELDQDFAPAHAGLSNTYLMRGGAPLNILPASIAMPIAKREAELSIKLDPNFGDAYEALALVQCWFDWDWKTASETAKKGTEVDPNSALAWSAYGHTLDVRGEHEDAIRAVTRALELDPLSGLILENAANIYCHARQYDQAEEFALRLLRLIPNFPIGVLSYCQILLATGKNKEAYALIEPMSQVMESYDFGMAILAFASGRSGHQKEAIKLAKKLEVQCGEGRASWADVALAYLGVEDTQRAFEFLKKAPDQRPSGGLCTAYLGVYPLFDSIRHDKRYQHVLQRLGLPASVLSLPSNEIQAAKDEKSIIVLPFENMSPDKENEYFSDGLTEEIIIDLSKINSIRVISRSSAMKLKRTKKDVKTIGHELNVRYVLEGSVRKAKDSLRITAELVDTETDLQLWAEKYSGTLDDVFDIQEKVSRAIVDALRLRLSPEEDDRMKERPMANVQAYECYLKARQEIWRFTEDALERALQLVRNARDIVGENELLHAVEGMIYWQFVNVGLKPVATYGDYLQKAEACAANVFRLNPESSNGYVLRGSIRNNRAQPADAIADFKKALSNDKDNPEALLWLAYCYAVSGRVSRARPLMARLLQVDPLTSLNLSVFGFIEFMEGNYEEGLRWTQRSIQMDPDNPSHRQLHALLLAANQRTDEACALLEQVASDIPHMAWAKLAKAMAYALRGDSKKTLEMMTPELRAAAWWDDIFSWWTAGCFALVGEHDAALSFLERAVEFGFINYLFLSQNDPFLEHIRGEARFQQLMADVKLKWEAFEA